MKKKRFVVLSLFAVMLFFSGSACNHEWQPWTLGATGLTRVCEICQTEESIEIDPEVYQQQLQQFQGQWTSTSVMNRNENGAKTDPTFDYSITFAEDGTFTASLDQERTGTWSLDRVDPDYRFYYKLHFDGIDEAVEANFFMPSQELSFSGILNSSWYEVRFAQMNEEEQAARAAAMEEAKAFIVGNWHSVTVYQQADDSTAVNTGYAISFSPDGTFTANLEEGTSGRWSVGSVISYNGQSYDHFNYNLVMDGTGTILSATLFDDQLDLDISNGRIAFGQYTDEELKMVEESTSRITGSWSSSYGSLTVNPDGTYESTLSWLPNGTWRFRRYLSDKGWDFYFYTDPSHAIVYTLLPDGILDCWFPEGDEFRTAPMTKE